MFSRSDPDSDEEPFEELPFANWNFLTRVIFDIFLLTLAGIFFGFVVNCIIPAPTPNEKPKVAFAFLIVQMIISTVILLMVESFYVRRVGRSSSTYFASNVFTLIFFLSQPQIFVRVYIIAKKTFGLDISTPVLS